MLTASGIRVSQWIKVFFTNWTTIIRRGRGLSSHVVEEKIESDFSWWCRSRLSSRAYDPFPLVLSFGFNDDCSVVLHETLGAKVASGYDIIDASIMSHCVEATPGCLLPSTLIMESRTDSRICRTLSWSQCSTLLWLNFRDKNCCYWSDRRNFRE